MIDLLYGRLMSIEEREVTRGIFLWALMATWLHSRELVKELVMILLEGEYMARDESGER